MCKEISAERVTFINLFVEGMSKRIDYARQFQAYYFLLFCLPMSFALVVIPLKISGAITVPSFLSFMVVQFLITAIWYSKLVLEDSVQTDACVNEIFTKHPTLRSALVRSAPLQWLDHDRDFRWYAVKKPT